ncbi:MAG: HAMP domain-containing sensor histidine kinase, partial [bacterium]
AGRYSFRINDFQRALTYYSKTITFANKNQGLLDTSILKHLQFQKALTLEKLGFKNEAVNEFLSLYKSLLKSPQGPGWELKFLADKSRYYLSGLFRSIRDPVLLNNNIAVYNKFNNQLNEILNAQDFIGEVRKFILPSSQFIYFKREIQLPVFYRMYNNRLYGIIRKGELPYSLFGGFEIDTSFFIRKLLYSATKDLNDHNFTISCGENVIYANGTAESAEPGFTTALGNRLHFLNLNIYETENPSLLAILRRKDVVYIGTIIILTFIIIIGGRLVYTGLRREMEFVRVKSAFLSGISHDLKTPLTSIRLYGEILQSGKLKSEEKKGEYYKVITRQSERLTQMINNVLDFTRFDYGKICLNIKEWNVSEIIGNVMDIFQPKFSELQASMSINDFPQEMKLKCDKDSVIQVLSNLIDNALIYTRLKHPQILLRIIEENKFIRIEVEDKGVGMTRTVQGKIFEDFYRGKSEITKEKGGTGLGLAIVRRIVEAHKWRIDVSSQIDIGSIFRITIPKQV